MNILDLLLPKSCISCNTTGSYICQKCIEKIQRHKQVCVACREFSKNGATHSYCQKLTNINSLIVATKYNQVMKKIIHQIKYKFSQDAIIELCKYILISNKIKNYIFDQNFDSITCISLHYFRYNWRGFNISEKIAIWLSNYYSIPFIQYLTKTRNTAPQAGQKRIDRLFAQKDSYKFNESKDAKLENILLVDDVITTAATVEEAASMLRSNGAKKIVVLALSGH